MAFYVGVRAFLETASTWRSKSTWFRDMMASFLFDLWCMLFSTHAMHCFFIVRHCAARWPDAEAMSSLARGMAELLLLSSMPALTSAALFDARRALLI